MKLLHVVWKYKDGATLAELDNDKGTTVYVDLENQLEMLVRKNLLRYEGGKYYCDLPFQ